MRMTLDELINAMEPQARKDKALISKCVDGLTEYAAELRQKAGDAGKEQISALRRLVDELAGYWGLDAKTVDHWKQVWNPAPFRHPPLKKANSWEPLRWDRRVSPGWPSQRH